MISKSLVLPALVSWVSPNKRTAFNQYHCSFIRDCTAVIMSLRQFILGSVIAGTSLSQDSDEILFLGLVLLLGLFIYWVRNDLKRTGVKQNRSSPRAKAAPKVSFETAPAASSPKEIDFDTTSAVLSAPSEPVPVIPESLTPVISESSCFQALREEWRKSIIVPGVSNLSPFDKRRQEAAERSLPKLRSMIQVEYGNEPAVLGFLTDYACYRFLRARDGDAAAAMQMIRVAIQWRRKYDMFNNKPRCTVCEKHEPRAHAYFCMGLDTHDRAVMYSCSARAVEQKNVEAGIFHMVCEMEHVLNDDAGVAQIVWVVDFNGFKARHSNPELGRQSIGVFQQVYPERLGQLVLLDFPWLFSVFFKLISPLIDPLTRSKILVLRTPAERAKYFNENWTPEMVKWINEIAQMPAAPGVYPEPSTIRGRYWT